MRAEPGPARPLILRTIAQNAGKASLDYGHWQESCRLSSVHKNPATHLKLNFVTHLWVGPYSVHCHLRARWSTTLQSKFHKFVCL